MEEKNPYLLLRSRAIYDILDGDAVLGTVNDGSEIKMPYQSGPALVLILNHFGNIDTYDNRSRWMYVEALLEHCIAQGKVSEMLAYFFSLERFGKQLEGLDRSEIERRYKATIELAISKINGHLLFGGHELRAVGNNYVVTNVDNAPSISLPAIKAIDKQYVKDLAARADRDIANGDFDSALTKARTLLEETFCYVIEKKNETPSSSGSIAELYKQVKKLYNMHSDKDMDIRVKKLLSGLETIVQSVSEMRNKDSDSHGVGSKRLALNDYHARLAVNASANMADFVLSVAAANKNWRSE